MPLHKKVNPLTIPTLKKGLKTGLLLCLGLFTVLALFRQTSSRSTPRTLPGGVFVGTLPELGEVILSCWQQDDTVSGGIVRTASPGRMRLEGVAPRTGKFGFHFHPDSDEEQDKAWQLVGDSLLDPDTLTGVLSIPGSDRDYPVKLSRIGSYSGIHAKSGIRLFGRGLTREFQAALPFLQRNQQADAAISGQLLARTRELIADFTRVTPREIWDGARYGFWSEYESWDHFEPVGMGPDWISLRWMHYEYTGGAHGNWGITGLNWRLDDTEPSPIQLHQLFRQDSPWVEFLSGFCIEFLKQQGASSVVDNSISSLTTNDLTSFTLHQHGIEMIFNPYSVASYAEGAFVVPIPWETIAHLRPPQTAIP